MTKNVYIDNILKQLPETPGVYQYYNSAGEIIYVGKAKNLKRRVSSYFNKEHDNYKTKQLVNNIADIQYVIVNNEQDAFLLENNLIKRYQPHYNILLKDGKSYPSICITKEAYPRIFKTRNIDKKIGEFFGPYSFSYSVDLVLDLLHTLYPIRTCRLALTDNSIAERKHKVCLKYHLKKCCGICEGLISKNEYASYVASARQIIVGDAEQISNDFVNQMKQLATELRFEEAQKIKIKHSLLEKFRSKTVITNVGIKDVDVFGYDEQGNNAYISILRLHKGSIVQGKTIEYKRSLTETKEEILAYGILELREQLGSETNDVVIPFEPDWHFDNLRFICPKSGDKKKLLNLAMQNVHQYKADRLKQSDKLNPDQRAVRILGELQNVLGLEDIPVWIDSFDNSNLHGMDAVASCVVFKKARPSKKDYKRFIIKSVKGIDDYASMREIAYRRYSRLLQENAGLPNLIIADGGLGQMHALKEVVEQQLGLHIPVAGLVKDDRHRTSCLLFGEPANVITLKVTDETFKLLTQIQDEVHRFAISFHRKRRSKKQTSSVLDEIKGIGEMSKNALLKHFESVKRIRMANIEELVDVIGKSKGSMVYNYFNGDLSR